MLKFLIDMPLSPSLAKWLANRGHDAVHAAAIHLEQAPDTAIFNGLEMMGVLCSPPIWIFHDYWRPRAL